MTSRYERHHNPPPERPKRTTSGVLKSTGRMLTMAELGLSDLDAPDAERRMSGVCNLVVYGVATTATLKQLSSKEDRFWEWYAPVQAMMKTDPLLKYFWDLRSQIVKEGDPGAINSAFRVGSFNTSDVWAEAPVGAVGFTLDGKSGTSYWRIAQPDGSEERYYVTPPEVMEATLVMQFGEDAPTSHRGKPLTDTSIQTLGLLYVDYLKGIVAQAGEHFG